MLGLSASFSNSFLWTHDSKGNVKMYFLFLNCSLINLINILYLYDLYHKNACYAELFCRVSDYVVVVGSLLAVSPIM